jgi:hypothetical protein
MSFEVVEHGGTRYAEILWADTRVESTKFFSAAESSFQFGLLAHPAGFVEPAHFHHGVTRTILDTPQMLVVQRGAIAVDFYSDDGALVREVTLRAGDGIVLIHGIHAIRVLEDMQCISVKQGPFLGAEHDKVAVTVKRDPGL